MKNRTHRYLGTFVNNDEGNSSYKLMVKNVRNTVTGGRFVKMFRGNKRDKTQYGSAGCARKEGSTHFDVYLLTKWSYNGFRQSEPKFFNFTLG